MDGGRKTIGEKQTDIQTDRQTETKNREAMDSEIDRLRQTDKDTDIRERERAREREMMVMRRVKF